MKPQISITTLLLLIVVACLTAGWHRATRDLRRLQQEKNRLELLGPEVYLEHMTNDFEELALTSPEVEAAEEQLQSVQRVMAAYPEEHSDHYPKLEAAKADRRAAYEERRDSLCDMYVMIKARMREWGDAMDRLERLNAQLENIKETVPYPKSSPRYRETARRIRQEELRLENIENRNEDRPFRPMRQEELRLRKIEGRSENRPFRLKQGAPE